MTRFDYKILYVRRSILNLIVTSRGRKRSQCGGKYALSLLSLLTHLLQLSGSTEGFVFEHLARAKCM